MKCFYFLFLIISFVFTTHAQTNAKKPPKECSPLLAKQLVEQQAIESKSVAETDNRINILLRVADFLWLSDEETARKFFAEAFQIAVERLREKADEKKDSEGLVYQQRDYRFTVIGAVAKRDAEWAKKLTETVLKEFDEDKEREKRDDIAKDDEIHSILGIAGRMAKENPNLSLTLARRAMRYPLIYAWYWTLYIMAGNNPPLADQIYGELLANYQNAEVYRLLYLSAYPFGQQKIFGVEKYSLGTSVPAGFSPNKNLQRQFLLTLFRRVMRLTPESTTKSLQNSIPESAIAATALNEIDSIVAQQFPDLLESYSQARVHANSVAATNDLEAARKLDEQGKSFNKPFDERLKEVEKADTEGKLTDGLIFQLVNSAKTEDDYRQTESWLDKMSDEAGRDAVTDFFYFQRSKLATKEKRFDDGRKFALKVDKIEHRAVLFFDIAEAKMREPMTKLESLDTLLEVYQTALKAPDTVEKAQVLLGLAFMYEKVDRYNALNSLADAIKTANKLESPNLTSSFISRQISLKNLTFYTGYSVPGFDVTETFYALSRQDFQGALGNATNFSDKYLRTLAILATVKDCEKNDAPIKQKAKTK